MYLFLLASPLNYEEELSYEDTLLIEDTLRFQNFFPVKYSGKIAWSSY